MKVTFGIEYKTEAAQLTHSTEAEVSSIPSKGDIVRFQSNDSLAAYLFIVSRIEHYVALKEGVENHTIVYLTTTSAQQFTPPAP